MTSRDPDRTNNDVWGFPDFQEEEEDDSQIDGEDKGNKDLVKAIGVVVTVDEGKEEVKEFLHQKWENLEVEEHSTEDTNKNWFEKTPWIVKIIVFLGVSLTAVGALVEPGSALSMRLIGVISLLALFLAWHELEKPD